MSEFDNIGAKPTSESLFHPLGVRGHHINPETLNTVIAIATVIYPLFGLAGGGLLIHSLIQGNKELKQMERGLAQKQNPSDQQK